MNQPLFYPGQKVICTDANFALVHTHQILHPHHKPITTPVEGPTYTVRDVFVFDHAVGITLVEIVNPQLAPGVPEPNWNQGKFAALPDMDSVALTEEVEESSMIPA